MAIDTSTSRQRATAMRAGTAVNKALQNCRDETPGGVVLPQRRRKAGAAPWTIPYPITQRPRKPPISQKLQPKDASRKTGKATTNQTSLAPNKKKRAKDRTLIPSDLENSDDNEGLSFILPKSAGKTKVGRNANAKPAAIQPTALLKPKDVRSTPPRKNPTPFRAFLEPVRIATHLKSCDSPVCASSAYTGTTTLIALLALILLRSFAMPLIA